VFPKDGRLDAVRFFSLQTSIVTTLLPPSQFGGLLELWPALSELLRVNSSYVTRDNFDGAEQNLPSKTSSVSSAKRLHRDACAEH
jgi:hypothetical protein